MDFSLNFLSQEICFCNKEEVIYQVFCLAQKEKVLLFASFAAIERYQLAPLLEEVLAKKGAHWANIHPNPSVNLVSEMLETLGNQNFTAIVAIGGGSCIDLAKAYCAFTCAENSFTPDEIRESIQTKQYLHREVAVPLYALPTTAGTGSEVTQWATIWDTEENKKLSIDAEFLLPKAAWVTPQFTFNAPPLLTLSTALDALSHAMESCWVKKSNPYSFSLAKTTACIVADVLPKLMLNLQDPKLRAEMSKAALLAGLAFSQTRTGAAHAISYALTLEYDIPHGIAAAISLPKILSLTQNIRPELVELETPFEKHGGFST